MPLCSRIRRAFTSGITSGTFGSIRKADELSITTAPALTAIGANLREMLPPAENSAMSTPSKERSFNSSMTIRIPRKSSVLPADRALASAFSLRTGNLRRSTVAMNSAPTAPVTPAMAMTGSFFTLVSSCLRMIFTENRYPLSGIMRFRDHAPDKKAPVLFRRGFGSTGAKVRLRAHVSSSPRGLRGFRGGFRGRHHGADLCGRVLPPSTAWHTKIGINTVESGRPVTHKPSHEPSQPFRTQGNRRQRAHRQDHDAAWRGADAGLHAGRHIRRDEGRSLARRAGGRSPTSCLAIPII